jgi:hypothetical protein
MEQIMKEWMAKMEAIMDTHYKEMRAIRGSCLEKMKASPETTEACPMKTRACLGEKESTPEETEVVVEPHEVPKGAMDEETIGATEDECEDLCLAVGCRRQLKMRTKRDGRLRQECAATIRWLTRHTVPAMRKGGLGKGLGKKCCSDIRGKTSGSRIENRGLKQRRTKDNAV